MDTIKLERWKPVSENSNILEYAGPRTAETAVLLWMGPGGWRNAGTWTSALCWRRG